MNMISVKCASHLTVVVLMFSGLLLADSDAEWSEEDKHRCINETYWSTDECGRAAFIIYKDKQMIRSHCDTPGALSGELNGSITFFNCNTEDIKFLEQLLCSDNVTASNCSFLRAVTGTTEKLIEKLTSAVQSTTTYVNRELTSATSNTTENVSDIDPVIISTFITPRSWPLINDTMREKIMDFLDNVISSQCKLSISRRIPRQLKKTKRICMMFEQSGKILINNHICSTDEVIKLTSVFCRLDFTAGLRKPADTPEGRRDQAFDIISNDLTEKCHSLMYPQAAMFTGSLSAGCNLLQQASTLLVQSGFCSQSDIDMLDPIVCYVTPKDPKTVQLQTKLDDLFQEINEFCNTTVKELMANTTNEADACLLWSSSKNNLLTDEKCSDHDINLLTKGLCSGQKVVSVSMHLVILLFAVHLIQDSIIL